MLCFDPLGEFTFTLDAHEGIPEERRARFRARPMTARQTIDFTRRLAAVGEGDPAQQVAALQQMLRLNLLAIEVVVNGTRHQISIDDAPDHLSLDELFQVPLAMFRAQSLSAADRKKSHSGSASGAARSASTAPAAGAPIPRDQQPPSCCGAQSAAGVDAGSVPTA